MLGAGIGTMAITFSISQKANRQIKEAVNIYNAKLSTRSLMRHSELKLAFSGNSIGFNIQF